MADIDPQAIAQARAAGYSDTEIADHLAQTPGVKQAREAGYSDKEIIAHITGDKAPAPEAPAASGVAAGFTHGVQGIVNSDSATAKNFFGVGDGPAPTQDPNYVPANVINGFNPLKWNYSQIPQKIAEEAPGLTQHILAGSAGAKIGKTVGGTKGALIGGILGSAASLWGSSAGDAAKQDAVARTGDTNATPNGSDLTRAGLTSGASALAQAALPLRFVPGANKITSVGAQGALDAAKKYMATTAIGGATGSVGNAIDQIGNTIGTDKGVQFDPAQNANAALGGAVTAGAMGAPRALVDVAGAARRGEFGGDNAAATAAYAKRLQDAAGDRGLGSFMGAGHDFTSQENTKSGLRNELRDAAQNVRSQTALHPDVENTLQLAQDGKPLTANDISRLDTGLAASPDGANAAFLARQLRMAQLNENFGSYDTTNKKWSGGVSGVLDKNLGFLLNPTRLAAGTVATGFGMHLLGTSNPLFAASAAGSYLTARAMDNLTGARSPANNFAQRFADAQAMTRLPQTPQAPAAPPSGPAQPWGQTPPLQTGPTGPSVPPPGAPQPAQASPWGPRPPMAGPTGPSVPPPAPQAPPAAPAPSFNPMAMSMLKQKLKAGLPPEPAPVAPAVREAPPISPMALSMLKQKLKAGLPPEPVAPAPAPEQPPPAPPISPMALSMLKQKLKQGLPPVAPPAAANTPPITAQPAANTAPALNGASAPKSIADILSNVNAQAASPTPKKITKTDGKVESDVYKDVGGYTPIPEDRLVHRGLDIPEMAQRAVDANMEGKPKAARDNYYNSVVDTRTGRQDVINEVTAQHPEHAQVLQQLLGQLFDTGGDRRRGLAAVNHYAGLLSPDAGKVLKDRFASERERLWPVRKKKPKK